MKGVTEKLVIYRGLREKCVEQKKLSLQEFLHPLMLKVVSLICNKNIKILNAEKLPKKDEVCIYAFNHTNGHDFPTAACTVKNHFYILADYTMQKDLLVNIVNRLNGVIYVDRKNKESRAIAKDKLLEKLSDGKNVFIFPEGTWNLTPNKMMLPLNWGIIEIARLSGVPIIPAAIEYKDNKAYVNVGDRFYVQENDDKKIKIDELTDVMATLRWKLISSFGVTKRNSLPKDAYDQFVNAALATYKKLDYEYEQSVILKKDVTSDDVYECMNNVEVTKNNAFLLSKKIHN